MAVTEGQFRKQVRIGTSGWHYKHWKGNFYPRDIQAAEMFRHYMQKFDTVEINNSFYRLPTPEAVENWVQQSPPGFLFALKASRYITHMRKLLHPEDTTEKFMRMAEGFGNKLGPILFQFPPTWLLNQDRLADFLVALPASHRYAFEFRNPSWHTPNVYRLLERFNASFCIFDISEFQSPIEITSDLVYVRLHGPGKAYQGKYSVEALTGWANKIDHWAAENRSVFFYFDNDQAGFAAQNALELNHILNGQKNS
jgi:uncharacterized protein YecE (DUF72 family)